MIYLGQFNLFGFKNFLIIVLCNSFVFIILRTPGFTRHLFKFIIIFSLWHSLHNSDLQDRKNHLNKAGTLVILSNFTKTGGDCRFKFFFLYLSTKNPPRPKLLTLQLLERLLEQHKDHAFLFRKFLWVLLLN